MSVHPSDRELIEGIKGGSEAHFTHLYDRYFQRIYSFVYLRMRNRADAEEVTQETFIAVFEREAAKGVWTYDTLILSPSWDGLREDPRFVKAVEDARGRFETMLEVFEDARLRDELPSYLEQPLSDLLEEVEMQAPIRAAS